MEYRRVLIGFACLLIAAGVFSADCTSLTRDEVVAFDSHVVPVEGLISSNKALLDKSSRLIRLVRSPSVPYNFSHLYMRFTPSSQADSVKLNVATRTAEPFVITPTEKSPCLNSTFTPTGERKNEQVVEACQKAGNKNFIEIPLTDPIIIYEPVFFIDITLEEDSTSIYVPYLSYSGAKSVDDCWQYYKYNAESDQNALQGACVGITLKGEPYEPGTTIEGWTCDRAKFNDGSCDCGCGLTDPDCLVNPVSDDCSDGEVCWNGVCKNVGWEESFKDGQGNKACELSHYGTDDYCDVGCGSGFEALDPDCLFPDKAIKTPGVQVECQVTTNECGPDAWKCDPQWYNGNETCHCESVCGLPDPACANLDLNTTCPNNMVCIEDACDHPREWTCGNHLYNTSGSCDCNCGAYDPDCDYSAEVLHCTSSEPSCRPNGTCGEASCGNGFVDLVLDEQCDGGLGCGATCLCREHYEPYAKRELGCHPICGDKYVAEGEECDSTLGCQNDCKCSPGMTASGGECLGCGNGKLDGDEQCDNVENCDNSTCKCLEGYVQDGSLNKCVKDSNGGIIAVAVVVPIVVLAAIGVALFLVFYSRKKKKNGADEEAAVSAAVQSVAMEEMGASTTSVAPSAKQEIVPAAIVGVPATHLDKWGVEPTTADFGFGGAPVDVGIMMEQTFAIKNLSLPEFHYKITLPTSNKFLLGVVPESGTVDAGFSLAFKLSGILYCSKVINNAPVIVSVSFKDEDGSTVEEYISIDVVMQGKPSYRIDYDDLVFDKVIGEGSFGSVYKGMYTSHPAAIKTLKTVSQDALNDFIREIDMLGKLRNPYVLTFYGAVITHDKLCLVTEYMALGSLGAVLKKYSISPRLKIRLALDSVKGLAFLHEMNVMHRDIKPGNVLCSSLDLTAPVLCKISDFGTSRVDTGDSKDKAKGMGTPLYMAPEIFSGHANYTRAADVYSFGIMLAQIWNEVPPYSDCHFDTPFALATHVSAGNRPSIFEGCPDFYLQIMQQCWAADPAQRPSFADCVAYLQRVNDALEQQGDAPGTVHVIEKRTNKD